MPGAPLCQAPLPLRPTLNPRHCERPQLLRVSWTGAAPSPEAALVRVTRCSASSNALSLGRSRALSGLRHSLFRALSNSLGSFVLSLPTLTHRCRSSPSPRGGAAFALPQTGKLVTAHLCAAVLQCHVGLLSREPAELNLSEEEGAACMATGILSSDMGCHREQRSSQCGASQPACDTCHPAHGMSDACSQDSNSHAAPGVRAPQADFFFDFTQGEGGDEGKGLDGGAESPQQHQQQPEEKAGAAHSPGSDLLSRRKKKGLSPLALVPRNGLRDPTGPLSLQPQMLQRGPTPAAAPAPAQGPLAPSPSASPRVRPKKADSSSRQADVMPDVMRGACTPNSSAKGQGRAEGASQRGTGTDSLSAYDHYLALQRSRAIQGNGLSPRVGPMGAGVRARVAEHSPRARNPAWDSEEVWDSIQAHLKEQKAKARKASSPRSPQRSPPALSPPGSDSKSPSKARNASPTAMAGTSPRSVASGGESGTAQRQQASAARAAVTAVAAKGSALLGVLPGTPPATSAPATGLESPGAQPGAMPGWQKEPAAEPLRKPRGEKSSCASSGSDSGSDNEKAGAGLRARRKKEGLSPLLVAPRPQDHSTSLIQAGRQHSLPAGMQLTSTLQGLPPRAEASGPAPAASASQQSLPSTRPQSSCGLPTSMSFQADPNRVSPGFRKSRFSPAPSPMALAQSADMGSYPSQQHQQQRRASHTRSQSHDTSLEVASGSSNFDLEISPPKPCPSTFIPASVRSGPMSPSRCASPLGLPRSPGSSSPARHFPGKRGALVPRSPLASSCHILPGHSASGLPAPDRPAPPTSLPSSFNASSPLVSAATRAAAALLAPDHCAVRVGSVLGAQTSSSTEDDSLESALAQKWNRFNQSVEITNYRGSNSSTSSSSRGAQPVHAHAQVDPPNQDKHQPPQRHRRVSSVASEELASSAFSCADGPSSPGPMSSLELPPAVLVQASSSMGKVRSGVGKDGDLIRKLAFANQHQHHHHYRMQDSPRGGDERLSQYSISRGGDLLKFLQPGKDAVGYPQQGAAAAVALQRGENLVLGGGISMAEDLKEQCRANLLAGARHSMDLEREFLPKHEGKGQEPGMRTGSIGGEEELARGPAGQRMRGLKLTDYILGQPYENVRNHFAMHKKELGAGQFGVVRKCKEIDTGRVYACKTIAKKSIKCVEDADDIRKEVAIMSLLQQHPCFVRLKRAFEDSESVHIVMDLCKGGDLLDHITQKGPLPEPNAARLCGTMVEALLHCHCLGIIHRDVKPENILLANADPGADMKLVDFGVSTFIQANEVLHEVIGTPEYMAPEVIQRAYSTQSDIWSAGVVMYIAMTGIPPFWASNRQTIGDCILKKEVSFRSTKWAKVSQECKDLIAKMLLKDPKERIGASEILVHPWIVQHKQG